jgi:hypothetical protein
MPLAEMRRPCILCDDGSQDAVYTGRCAGAIKYIGVRRDAATLLVRSRLAAVR